MAGREFTRECIKHLDAYGEDGIFELYMEHRTVRKLLKNLPPEVGTMSTAPFYSWLKADEGVDELLVRRTTGEELAIRCRTEARTMPLNSKERRDMLLKASFYKQCGTEVRIDPDEGTMSGPPEALRNAFIWYRDRAKMNLTPEQEAFLAEGD